jgi:hypothetical protein
MSSFLRFLSGKQRPPSESLRQEAVSPSLPAATASPLLQEVLGATATHYRDTHKDQSRDGSPVLSQSLSVGARIADAKKRTIETGFSLIALADAQTAEVIKVLLEDLEKRVCCIAFAGQVKAGKSSLINALVEETGLLPADINPWTTVITRLHFGVPGKPQSGASFTFFTREEWQRLSIGGRTRELTERLFPDFDWSALKGQVEAMQERARRKLGARFEELLGTEHTYLEIDHGLLNRYVGAGDHGASHVEAGAEGEYSEITKTADVYLDLGPFSSPAILIDTPGVNDPFLVRDEITRQNLESADICVIVLTARQPLSVSDFGLLRMLRGLNKDRLIIFINKIDEISGGDEVLVEISRRLTAMLKQEFPSTDIPIVFGSAILAQKAMSLSRSEQLAAYAQDPSKPISSVYWPNHDEIAETLTADALFRKSGVASLAVAISQLLEAGPIAGSVGTAASLLAAVCRNLISWLETEICILCKIPSDRASAKSVFESVVTIQGRTVAEFDAFADRLRALCALKVQQLHQHLIQTVRASVEDLSTKPLEEVAKQVAQVDAELRIKLESVFQAALEDAGNAIIGEQEKLRAELTKLFEINGLAEKSVIFAGNELAGLPSPSALSEPAALGLTAGLNEFALREIPPSNDPNTHLAKVIAADFEPIIEKLADEASAVLLEKSASLEKKARALTLGPIEAAVGRVPAVIASVESPSPASPSAHQYVEQSIQTLRERLTSLKAVLIAGELAKHEKTDSIP